MLFVRAALTAAWLYRFFSPAKQWSFSEALMTNPFKKLLRLGIPGTTLFLAACGVFVAINEEKCGPGILEECPPDTTTTTCSSGVRSTSTSHYSGFDCSASTSTSLTPDFSCLDE